MPPTESTGIRNKNYLNVKNGASSWMDADEKESRTDSRGHAIFSEPAYGVRAGILLLRKYYFAHNLRTIAEILARWAPATDTVGSLPDAPPNSPLEYSTFVARRMGIGYNEPLDIFNPNKSINNIARLKDLFYAMSEFEIGNGFKVPVEDFNAGLELVQPGILTDGTSPASNADTAPTAGSGVPPPPALQWTISGSVGRRDKSAVNKEADITTVQEMLRHAAMILEDARIDPGAIDGKIGMDASKSATVQAIETFQSRFLALPDGVIDVGGRTWRELVSVIENGGRADAAPARPSSAPKFFFPFERLPASSWTTGMRRFGANRSNGRAHAGCDLYFPAGTVIHAIAEGTVIRGPYAFYLGTYALEIDHGSFIARYGEIQSATFVRNGDRVRAGQRIARVGHLENIQVPSDMLHLELYNKTASGPLTVPAAFGKKAPNGRPFMRRKDLIDPTPKLNEWKNNLPGARISSEERAAGLAGAIPSNGFCIHIKRLRQEKRASENHARTIAEYQCFWNGAAISELKNQIVERGGPGDNTTEIGDNRDLRIREGAYRLAIHNGVNYKTYNYKENGTTYEEKPKPGLLLMDTNERSAILIHPGVNYVRSIGCLNPASELADADSEINFIDSRDQVVGIIKALKSKMGTKFPRSGVIPDAIVFIEGEPDR